MFYFSNTQQSHYKQTWPKMSNVPYEGNYMAYLWCCSEEDWSEVEEISDIWPSSIYSCRTWLYSEWKVGYVFNVDIQNMHRQILVTPQHKAFQRLLFRPDSDSDVKEYQLNTVIFDVNCAPYLTIRTILQVARDYKNSYPMANKILVENMYVDDVLIDCS